jgi:predicted DNA-binding transcriptional regulator AlpA
MTRRLLSAMEVAARLGMPASEFYRLRAQLVIEGFPPPTIGRGRHQRAKYDSLGIERWMESKLPSHLRDTTQMVCTTTDSNVVAMNAWHERLASRLAGVA